MFRLDIERVWNVSCQFLLPCNDNYTLSSWSSGYKKDKVLPLNCTIHLVNSNMVMESKTEGKILKRQKYSSNGQSHLTSSRLPTGAGYQTLRGDPGIHPLCVLAMPKAHRMKSLVGNLVLCRKKIPMKAHRERSVGFRLEAPASPGQAGTNRLLGVQRCSWTAGPLLAQSTFGWVLEASG